MAKTLEQQKVKRKKIYDGEDFLKIFYCTIVRLSKQIAIANSIKC